MRTINIKFSRKRALACVCTTFRTWQLCALDILCNSFYIKVNCLEKYRLGKKNLWSIYSTAATFIGPRASSIPPISIYQLFNVPSPPKYNIFLLKSHCFLEVIEVFLMQTKQNVLKIFYYSTKLMFLQTLKRKRN